VNLSTAGGAGREAFGVYGQASGPAASAGTEHFGVYGVAGGAQYNAAGFFGNGGELVIPASNMISATPQLPRSWNGSMFTQAANTTPTGGRIYWASGSINWFVNASGSGDFSEYFKTADRTLAIGEVLALDPELANGVRRARPRDAASTLGIVSEFGSRNNDTRVGDRSDDRD